MSWLTPVRSLLILMLLSGPALAAGEPLSINPGYLGCKVVRALYAHYTKKGVTLDQMKMHLRGLGLSEAKIDGAEKCLPR